jgi:hypothetical protein
VTLRSCLGPRSSVDRAAVSSTAIASRSAARRPPEERLLNGSRSGGALASDGAHPFAFATRYSLTA